MVSAVSASSPLPTPNDSRKINPSAPFAFGPLQAGAWPASAAATGLTLSFPWLNEANTATAAPPEKRRTAEVNEKLADASTHDEVLAHGHAAAMETRQSQDRAAADRSQAEFGERRAAFRQAMRDVQQERAAGASGGKAVASGQAAEVAGDVARPGESPSAATETDNTGVRSSSASGDADSDTAPSAARSGASEARTQGDVPVRDASGSGRAGPGADASTGLSSNRTPPTTGSEPGVSSSPESAMSVGQRSGAAGASAVGAVSGAAGAGAVGAGAQGGGAGGASTTGSSRVDSTSIASAGATTPAGNAGRSPGKGMNSDAGQTAGAPGGEADGEISPQRVRIESMMRVLRAQIHRRDSSAVMRLDPAELGPLRVQMQWSDASVAVTLEVGNDLAHELLTEQVDSLRDGLERAGLLVERIEVKRAAETPAQNPAGDPQRNPAQERHAAGQDATPQQQRARHARTEADGGGARPASAAEPRDVRRVATGSSRLNLWA